MDASNYTAEDYGRIVAGKTTAELMLALQYSDNPAIAEAAILELRTRDDYRALVAADWDQALADNRRYVTEHCPGCWTVADSKWGHLDTGHHPDCRCAYSDHRIPQVVLDEQHAEAIELFAEARTNDQGYNLTRAEAAVLDTATLSHALDYDPLNRWQIAVFRDELHARAWRTYIDARLYVHAAGDNAVHGAWPMGVAGWVLHTGNDQVTDNLLARGLITHAFRMDWAGRTVWPLTEAGKTLQRRLRWGA